MPRPDQAVNPCVRVLAMTEKVTESGCWIFMGNINRLGYGRTSIGSRSDGTRRSAASAHRVVYEGLRGPIPDGLTLDHRCRVRCCVNPDHLEPVTQAENNRRGTSPSAVNGAKPICPKCGGAYRSRRRGGRLCPKCDTTYRVEATRRPHRIEATRARERRHKAKVRATDRDAYNARQRDYYHRKKEQG
jgi:uncharacterized Zn finger protein (UPF0148 family)